MSITLTKKQTISLEKAAGATLTAVQMGLGWDPAKPKGFLGKLFGGADSIDLDASCILLDGNAQLVDVVWFRQLKSHDGSVRHSGDNLTGEGDGDDETISVDLTRLPGHVQYLAFTVNSFRGQTFNEVDNAYCRIVDAKTDRELARFNLAEQGSHTGLLMAYMKRNGNDWELTAVGEKANGRTAQDLADIASRLVRS